MLIREVILENFMSYEYARMPFKPGVNVVCGPNGSGKSSMLHGISVALGQSYTERSRKLSDLIRWGKDQARVTLALDNSPRSGRRPVPRIKKDYIFLTRMLRRDGKYWFELENRAATRKEVERLLSKLGVDPDNMLIIMHQNMVGQFTVLSPQEKLRMVEAAVGLESYRKNVAKAQRKLSRIMSQEESVDQLLESAVQTLNYWREQYDRYQQKKQLRIKRNLLERELAWAEVSKREDKVNELRNQVQAQQSEALQIQTEAKTTQEQLSSQEAKLSKTKAEFRSILQEQLVLEYEQAKHEVTTQMASQALNETALWSEIQQKGKIEYANRVARLEAAFQAVTNPLDVKALLTELKETYEISESIQAEQLDSRSRDLKASIENSDMQLERLHIQVSDAKQENERLFNEMETINTSISDLKANLVLLQYRSEVAAKALQDLNRQLNASLAGLNSEVKKAEESGLRVITTKTPLELLDEIRVTDGHLAALADVSEDIERMYESYSTLYLELKEKAQLVSENRQKALSEVKTRVAAWKTVIQTLFKQVNLRYKKILSQAQAIGEVKLANEHDIEDAGLEIFVGFKGGTPVHLDSYTQSGGERSIATISFLLALQQHVRSPFRAVDEYDIHMDPKNREIIANLLVASVKGLDAQYLAITPSQVTYVGKDVHLITVQNVEGTSFVKEVI